MNTVRLTQTPKGEGSYHVEVALEAEGQPRQTAAASFDFSLSPQEAEDLRWYLEDYLQHPHDPAPKIAARVEKRIKEIGATLFRAVFQTGDDARDLWASLRLGLSDTRVEVVTGVSEASAVPWELLRDPATDVPLALRARSFVRAHPQPAQRPLLPRAGGDSIRILLVICRPGGDEDVPFRSVAMRILKGLSGSASEVFQLDVLRPPTFERLGEALRRAKTEGRPYHVVHFDGHGMFLDLTELFEADGGGGEAEGLPEALSDFDPRRYSPRSVYPREPRDGRRGYLAFENPRSPHNMRLVDGPELGGLLAEAGVPVLVMNACRSAHAEPPASPEEAGENADPHEKVRALGSLAQEVMDAGVAGVVAMRYNVYVVTAAQFVADLYAALAEGQNFGEAATLGRKKLNDQPERQVGHNPLPLQDWVVPVAYEAAPLTLVPRRAHGPNFSVSLEAGQSVTTRGSLDPQLPKRPDAGFFGRDGTLLKLDRLFDTQRVVLMHAYAGGGKTATAAEFARWYSLTDGLRGPGGAQGPVLFTSFEQHRTLPRVLDQLGQVFGESLESSGVHWLALDDAERRSVALDILRQVPVFWIWDNVEPVAGFPAGTESAWSKEEQRELADFLRDARDTQAKFLLTSRRDERSWLGDLPARVELPPMPMQERVQFARAIAERHGRHIANVEDWRPLLRFTQGNPLTVTVLVGQALRDNLQTREQIEGFVSRLRAGESAFEDEESEGRTKSLGASLSYGFSHAFNEQERKQLSPLHLFQGFVDVGVLCSMGSPQLPEGLPELRGMTREEGIALLDRAAEMGLLIAVGQDAYFIHPALPWFFKRLFEEHYPAPRDEGATVAFIRIVSSVGNMYSSQYNRGADEFVSWLLAEESNLLYARRLARERGRWHEVISTMQGLRALYEHQGRIAEWSRLVEESAGDFVAPGSEGPLPGMEDQWLFVNEYRVQLAVAAQKWEVAERLQNLELDYHRRGAAAYISTPAEELNEEQLNDIRSLAVVLHGLANIKRALNRVDYIDAFEESLSLFERIGDEQGAANCALTLANSYFRSDVRDLEKAESYLRRSLELFGERNRQGRAKCLTQLGRVSMERYTEAKRDGRPNEELFDHLVTALDFCLQGLDLTPEGAVVDLASKHSNIGLIYRELNDPEQALAHCREALRLEELQGDGFAAAKTRSIIAYTLMSSGRPQDALEYAQTAMRQFQQYGDYASPHVKTMQDLIDYINRTRSTPS